MLFTYKDINVMSSSIILIAITYVKISIYICDLHTFYSDEVKIVF